MCVCVTAFAHIFFLVIWEICPAQAVVGQHPSGWDRAIEIS
jgi:hypothetical protein